MNGTATLTPSTAHGAVGLSHPVLGLGTYPPAAAPPPRARDASLLTAEQERELSRRIALGDRGARERLIRSNLRLVIKIARAFAGRGMDLDDLVGEGNLGLIRAAERFDPEAGIRFGTYAGYWIKEAIHRALNDTASTIRVPAHMAATLRAWQTAERALIRELGREPTPREVADRLGLSEERRGMAEHALRARRLRTGHAGDPPDVWSPDDAPDAGAAPGAAAEDEDERQGLVRRLRRLDPREREVITLRFGLRDGESRTLKEVGRRMGVTREWVRKLEVRAVQKLR
jgi:RNA polymerase primary sigma factor